MNYLFFLICSLGIVYVFARGAIIDLKTEYVPDNIIIMSYVFGITYVVLGSIIQKNINVLLTGIAGFLIGFVIPWIITNCIYYYRYFSLKRKLKKNNLNIEIDRSKNDEIKQINISKKYFIIATSIIFILTIIISIVTKRYTIIIGSIIALILDQILSVIFKKYYVIREDYTEGKYNKTDEQSIADTIEEDLEVGVGSGDILLFGAIGLVSSPIGFLVTFVYTSFVHVFIIVLISIIKKINPFKYTLPFIPALSIGFLLYSTGCDLFLFNFIGKISSFLT